MVSYRLDILAALADTIASRASASPEESYTARLLSQGAAKCAKKLGEEAVEVALAGVLQDRRALASESADLLYHLTVLLQNEGLNLSDVVTRLQERHTK